MNENRLKNFPQWIKNVFNYLTKIRLPEKVVFLTISVLATIWFLVRVIPKPSRATYPCMQAAAPFVSSLFVWMLSLSGSLFAFKKAKEYSQNSRAFGTMLFAIIGITFGFLFFANNPNIIKADMKIWYEVNKPLGEAKGLFPGRVSWSHNPAIASWDGKTGFWWEDKFNKQIETDKLLSEILLSLTNKKTDKEAWETLFTYYNQTNLNENVGYVAGEKIAIKINMNNTDAHENTNRINANPQLILSLLNNLVNIAGVPQENITVADPSRFITDNIFDKCVAVFPNVHFVDHNGGEGREKATFIDNGFIYSYDFSGMTTGLATCFVEANYVINLALMKGHVSQGVTLNSKNFFGCVDIETDWKKNAHCGGFSQNRDGKRQYSVYPDFMGHKDLGAKTILFLVDGIYGHKFVDGIPEFKWELAPFNNQWPNSLFASQDGVAIESVVLDFALTEWPDAPDMMYSDHAMEEMAMANNPPSGAVYDPERDGTTLESLGVTEHWNNANDKQYSRNLGMSKGIELIYINSEK